MGFAAEGGRDCRATESSEWHAGLPLPGARACPTPLLRKWPPKNQVPMGGRTCWGHVSKPHGMRCISSVVLLLAAFPGIRLWDGGLPGRCSVGRLLGGTAVSRFGLRENLNYNRIHQGLPWWFSGRASTCGGRRHRFDSWAGKIPWRRKQQPTPVFLPGKCHGQWSLVGYSPWVCKRWHNLVTKPPPPESTKGQRS